MKFSVRHKETGLTFLPDAEDGFAIEWVNPSAHFSDGTIGPSTKRAYLLIGGTGKLIDVMYERFNDVSDEYDLIEE